MLATSYTLSATTELGFTEAVERVRDELKPKGFGVLCEIDVQATLKEKLGVDGEPYLILGACNPPLAHQALEAEPDLGVLLPCNVVVYQRDGETHVSAIDAERMLSIVGNDELAPIAAEVRQPARSGRRARSEGLSRCACSRGRRQIDAGGAADLLAARTRRRGRRPPARRVEDGPHPGRDPHPARPTVEPPASAPARQDDRHRLQKRPSQRRSPPGR